MREAGALVGLSLELIGWTLKLVGLPLELVLPLETPIRAFSDAPRRP